MAELADCLGTGLSRVRHRRSHQVAQLSLRINDVLVCRIENDSRVKQVGNGGKTEVGNTGEPSLAGRECTGCMKAVGINNSVHSAHTPKARDTVDGVAGYKASRNPILSK